MDVSIEKFHNWKHDPVTKQFMDKLRWIKEYKKQEILDPDTIRSDNGRYLQHEYLGGVDIIDLILNITYPELKIPNYEEDEDVNIV